MGREGAQRDVVGRLPTISQTRYLESCGFNRRA